ncbi:uncharacterized protein BP5553_09723 [Venustampulla echinocandica]|uniref:Uncharacterized protein n=1 Tax=Venustampulla echinocandica TaxID=2656787 RepID=A0A370TBT0_9HELO|nr:uncharacterized protein BP5553_09723 [Venustampulla echinocandica]RDL31514.1 hypothetical protein BP5553_09723 [Venustampulla echinocandica]
MEKATTAQKLPEDHMAKGQNDKMTIKQWNSAFSSMGREFKSFPVKNYKKPYTPQADMGIGPVNYDVTFLEARLCKRSILILNELVKVEKKLGDVWLKAEATLLFSKYGKEDPISWLPAAQRLGIRRDMRRLTAGFVKRLRIADHDDAGVHAIFELLEDSDSRAERYGGENPATIALISSLAPRGPRIPGPFGTVIYPIVHRNFTEAGIASILKEDTIQRVRANAAKRLVIKMLFNKSKNEAKDGEQDVTVEGGDKSAHATEPTQSMAEKMINCLHLHLN